MRVKAAILLLCAVLAWVAAGGTEAGTPPPGPARQAGMTVLVTFPDGNPAVGAAVTIGRGRYAADDRGAVHVPAAHGAHGVVSGDITREEGGFLGLFRKPVRYAGFSLVNPGTGAMQDIRLVLSLVTDMDQACRSCHPDKHSASGQVVRCVHKSGIPVKPEQEARVIQFNSENEALRRSGRAGYPPIFLERRKTHKGFWAKTRSYMVCESCHTNHVATGVKAYATMPFEDRSILCRGCHL